MTKKRLAQALIDATSRFITCSVLSLGHNTANTLEASSECVRCKPRCWLARPSEWPWRRSVWRQSREDLSEAEHLSVSCWSARWMDDSLRPDLTSRDFHGNNKRHCLFPPMIDSRIWSRSAQVESNNSFFVANCWRARWVNFDSIGDSAYTNRSLDWLSLPLFRFRVMRIEETQVGHDHRQRGCLLLLSIKFLTKETKQRPRCSAYINGDQRSTFRLHRRTESEWMVVKKKSTSVRLRLKRS